VIPIDQQRCVLEVGSGLPRWVIVTNPTDEVLEQAVFNESPRIKDFLNFPLLLVVNDNRRGLGLRGKLRRQRVSGGGFQEGDVENWMDSHGIWEIQLISVGGDSLEDAESPQSLII
jgi:hypothetical protein